MTTTTTAAWTLRHPAVACDDCRTCHECGAPSVAVDTQWDRGLCAEHVDAVASDLAGPHHDVRPVVPLGAYEAQEDGAGAYRVVEAGSGEVVFRTERQAEAEAVARKVTLVRPRLFRRR